MSYVNLFLKILFQFFFIGDLSESDEASDEDDEDGDVEDDEGDAKDEDDAPLAVQKAIF